MNYRTTEEKKTAPLPFGKTEPSWSFIKALSYERL